MSMSICVCLLLHLRALSNDVIQAVSCLLLKCVYLYLQRNKTQLLKQRYEILMLQYTIDVQWM